MDEKTELSMITTSLPEHMREFISRFEFGEYTGWEGNAFVVEGTEIESNMSVFFKYIEKDSITVWEDVDRTIPYEVGILLRVRCISGVVHFIEQYVFQHHHVLVFERPLNFLNLQNFIMREKFISERIAKKIFAQLVQILIDCYEVGVYHGNINPVTICINVQTHEVCLNDFGNALFVPRVPDTNRRPHSSLSLEPEERYFDESKTVLHIGLILHYMLIRNDPYDEDGQLCVEAIMNRYFLSIECRSLLCALLDTEIGYFRPPISTLLQYPWVTSQESSSDQDS